MKAAQELPPQLWPFRPVEIYAFTNGGARFAFAEPQPLGVALLLFDVVETKHELAAALKTVRNPRTRDDSRKLAAARVAALRRELISLHLEIRKLSIGYRVSPTAPIHYWP